MAVTTTFRLIKKYFESNPMYTEWDEMQITNVIIRYRTVIGGTPSSAFQEVKAQIGIDIISASVNLESETTYEVRAVAFSSFVPDGIESDPIEFDSSDATKYYNAEFYVVENDPGVSSRIRPPIEGAVFTINPGTGSERSFTSRADGLVWMQRLEAGEYTYDLVSAGHVDIIGATVYIGPRNEKLGFIELVPV